MNEEFKKVKLPNETRYVLETTTAGAIGTNSIATAEKPLGELQRRQTISVPVNQKPRQGPMKSQTGAGAHRDKKKEQKQGKEKHRKPFDEEKGVAEGYVNDASEGTKFMIVYNKHHPNPAAHGKPVTGDGKPWIITATDRRAALDKAHEYFVRSQTVSSFRGYVDAVPVEQGVAEGDQEPDHEISMASNELQSIMSDAKKLLVLIKRYSEMEGLEAWQQSKITKSADYLTAVLRSIGGEQGALESQVNEYETHTYKDSQGNVWRVNDEGEKELLRGAPGSSYGGSRYGSRYPSRSYSKPSGMYFYNVKPGQENDAQSAGLKQSKSGKWYSTYQNSQADKLFGPGKFWQPKNEASVAEGMNSLSFWKREAQKAGGAANIDWYAIGVEHGKQGIVMNPPYGVGAKAVTLYGKGLDAGQQGVAEGKKKGVDGKACWKGYKRMGTKKKGGRTVDNCVPVGEDSYIESLMNQLYEKAPPGDKYERIVKHIKAGYRKDGKLTDVEKRKAYGAAWKAKNKSKK
jgi:hypothetical protein